MKKPGPNRHSSLLRGLAMAGLCWLVVALLVGLLAPWLRSQVWSTLELPLLAEFGVVAVLALALRRLVIWLARLVGRGFSAQTQSRVTRAADLMPRAQAAQEMREVAPYLQVMSRQLEGAVKDSEAGVLRLAEQIRTTHQVANEQISRIHDSETYGQELTQIIRDKVMIDEQLGAILKMFADEQEAEAHANLSRIHRLQQVKDLAPMMDDIAAVARQTNFLAINAAIEAARVGAAGRGFAVLASEIRELSNRTAAVVADITQKIDAATEGVNDELSMALATGEQRSAGSSMRSVVDDISRMQERFSRSSDQLQRVIDGVKGGHEHIVLGLSDALAEMQFQDVMQQRIEQVRTALLQLDDHLRTMADQLVDLPWDPETMVSMREQLEQQVQRYVMESQRQAHASVTGQAIGKQTERPAIELF